MGQATSEWGEANEAGLARIRGEARTSWIVDPPDGHMPLTAQAKKARQAPASFDGPEARPAAERCLLGLGAPAGPPLLNPGYNANYQIVQTRDAVVLISEMNHDARIVRLGGARHPPAGVALWMGDSVGRWERETLVVETANIRPAGRVPLSPGAKVTERFTRIAPDQIDYQLTVDDPTTYTRAWRGEELLRALGKPIYEAACHEGNYSLPNILAGRRYAERAGAAPEPAEREAER